MYIMIILGLLALVGSSGYLIYFLRRLLVEYIHITMDVKIWIIIIIISIIFTLPALNLFSIYAVGYFYFIGASIIFTLISLFIHESHIRFLCETGILAVMIVALFIGYGFYNMNHVVETKYQLYTDKIDHLRVLLVSDLHFGMNMNTQDLEKHVSTMSQSHPDIVILDGDIVDESTGLERMKECFYILSKIENTSGIYYVYGNHDDNKYSRTPYFNHDDIKEECIKNHITVLEDEIITIKEMTLVGRKDASIQRMTSKQLSEKVNKDNYIIVLDHQPLDMKENSEWADLQLSGHTHGGQIWPTGYLQAIATKSMRYGIKTINDFHTITTSGIAGWGYSIKTGAPSEYVVIDIDKK